MRTLCDLLATWEKWSARETLRRSVNRANKDDGREALRRGLDEATEVDPLDALQDAAELASLLLGWQWQAVHAARVRGATWDEIGRAVGTSCFEARHRYNDALDRQEALRPNSTETYREVL